VTGHMVIGESIPLNQVSSVKKAFEFQLPVPVD